jgi:DNA polymerase III delta prime subunit
MKFTDDYDLDMLRSFFVSMSNIDDLTNEQLADNLQYCDFDLERDSSHSRPQGAVSSTEKKEENGRAGRSRVPLMARALGVTDDALDVAQAMRTALNDRLPTKQERNKFFELANRAINIFDETKDVASQGIHLFKMDEKLRAMRLTVFLILISWYAIKRLKTKSMRSWLEVAVFAVSLKYIMGVSYEDIPESIRTKFFDWNILEILGKFFPQKDSEVKSYSLKLNEAKPQFFDGFVLEESVDVFAGAIMSGLGIAKLIPDSKVNLGRDLNTLLRLKSTLPGMMTNILNFIDKLQSMVFKTKFGNIAARLSKDGSPCLEKFFKDFDDILEENRTGKLEINIANFERLKALEKVGVDILKDMKRLSTSNLSHLLSGNLNIIRQIMATFQQHNLYNCGFKFETILILFYGAPGTSKSLTGQYLARSLVNMHKPAIPFEDLQENFAQHTFVRNAEVKYWDGYRNTESVVFFDDLGQVRDAPGNVDNEFMNIIRAANAFEYHLHMAAMEAKIGKNFQSPFIVATTNAESFKNAGINYTGAFARRVDFYVKLTVNRKYQDKNQHIDLRKTAVVEDIHVIDPEYLDFNIMKYVEQKNEYDIGETINYKEFLRRIKTVYAVKTARLKSHQTNFNNILKKYGDFRMSGTDEEKEAYRKEFEQLKQTKLHVADYKDFKVQKKKKQNPHDEPDNLFTCPQMAWGSNEHYDTPSESSYSPASEPDEDADSYFDAEDLPIDDPFGMLDLVSEPALSDYTKSQSKDYILAFKTYAMAAGLHSKISEKPDILREYIAANMPERTATEIDQIIQMCNLDGPKTVVYHFFVGHNEFDYLTLMPAPLLVAMAIVSDYDGFFDFLSGGECRGDFVRIKPFICNVRPQMNESSSYAAFTVIKNKIFEGFKAFRDWAAQNWQWLTATLALLAGVLLLGQHAFPELEETKVQQEEQNSPRDDDLTEFQEEILGPQMHGYEAKDHVQRPLKGQVLGPRFFKRGRFKIVKPQISDATLDKSMSVSAKNVSKMYTVDEDGKETYRGHVLHVTSKYALVASHFILKFESVYTEKNAYKNALVKFRVGKVDRLTVTMKQLLNSYFVTEEMSKSDIAVLKFEYHPPVKSIFKNFITEEQLLSLPLIFEMSYFEPRRQVLMVTKGHVCKDMIISKDEDLHMTLVDTIKYIAKSSDGDCGIPLMAEISNNSSSIIGIHVAGNTGKSRAYAGIVTQESLQEIFDNFGVDDVVDELQELQLATPQMNMEYLKDNFEILGAAPHGSHMPSGKSKIERSPLQDHPDCSHN